MFTSSLYKVYETIPPLVTSWYTIWAKVILIVATYRRVVTTHLYGNTILVESDYTLRCIRRTGGGIHRYEIGSDRL